METGTLIWIVIIIILTLAIYITYGAVYGTADYAGKDEMTGEMVIFSLVSAVTFLSAGIIYGAFGSPIAAMIAMIISLISDYIIAFMVGSVEADGTVWRLAFARYMAFVSKTALLTYLAFSAGAYSQEKASVAGKTLFGSQMYRRGDQEKSDFFAARRRGMGFGKKSE